MQAAYTDPSLVFRKASAASSRRRSIGALGCHPICRTWPAARRRQHRPLAGPNPISMAVSQRTAASVPGSWGVSGGNCLCTPCRCMTPPVVVSTETEGDRVSGRQPVTMPPDLSLCTCGPRITIVFSAQGPSGAPTTADTIQKSTTRGLRWRTRLWHGALRPPPAPVLPSS